MEDKFSDEIRHSKRITSLPSKNIVPKAEWDSYYKHFTLRIESVSEYIDIISRLSKIAEYHMRDPLVFRGHSDASANYKLIPTIARKGKNLEFCEYAMTTEMLKLRPDEFDNITTNFDLMSKLQHFGLPTRLLDFTYNPLIALFFACNSNKKLNGRVICTYDTSSSSTTQTIETICGMYKYNDYNALSLDKLVGGVSKLKKYASDTIEPLMERPKYSNDRIKRQSAVFMIFPNIVRDHRSRAIEKGREFGDEKEYRFFPWNDFEEKRAEYLRFEPNVYSKNFYVNTDTIRNLLKYYSNKYDDFYINEDGEINSKYHFIFSNRFSIEELILPLSKEQLSNSFISILVDSKHKKEILNDLASIGINKSFVFPELEYTAEMVKERFYDKPEIFGYIY